MLLRRTTAMLVLLEVVEEDMTAPLMLSLRDFLRDEAPNTCTDHHLALLLARLDCDTKLRLVTQHGYQHQVPRRE